jgi:hypothetical protein
VTAYDRPQLFWVTLVGRVEEEPIDNDDTLWVLSRQTIYRVSRSSYAQYTLETIWGIIWHT